VEPFSSLRLAVGVPAADLRSAPRPRAERLTQLLYGETVTARAAKGGWLRVEAEEQRHLVRGKWCGYPGWVRADALTGARPPAPTAVIRSPSVELCSGKRHLRLSLGTRLAAWPRGRGWIARLLEGSSVLVPSGALAPLARVPQKDHCRRLILKTAAQLLGRTYHWGGHSGVQPRHDTGVDCSGLTSLAYRACGIELPRDAHQQMLLARALSRRELKPADLIFLTAGGASRRITHVMLYEGGERILESRHSAGRILRCSFSQRFGVPLRRLESGTAVLDLTFPRPRRRRIYFGSYL
jgi:cell wall-associated NlpC family hydrolase